MALCRHIDMSTAHVPNISILLYIVEHQIYYIDIKPVSHICIHTPPITPGVQGLRFLRSEYPPAC